MWYDLPALQYRGPPTHACSPQLSLVFVSWVVGEWGVVSFKLAGLGKRKKKQKTKTGHPYSQAPSRRHLGPYKVQRTKTRTGGVVCVGGRGCDCYSQRSSTAQTIRPIIEVNTFISGLLVALVPVHFCMGIVLTNWTSQSSDGITYATFSRALPFKRDLYI